MEGERYSNFSQKFDGKEKSDMKDDIIIKRWELISAYSDGELDIERAYQVKKKIENDNPNPNNSYSYKRIYEDINKLKDLLGSMENHQVSDSFNDNLMKKINSGDNPPNTNNIVNFKKNTIKAGTGLAAAAVLVLVLVFALRAGYNFNDNEVNGDIISASESDNSSKSKKAGVIYPSTEDNNEVKETDKPVILGPDEAKTAYADTVAQKDNEVQKDTNGDAVIDAVNDAVNEKEKIDEASENLATIYEEESGQKSLSAPSIKKNANTDSFVYIFPMENTKSKEPILINEKEIKFTMFYELVQNFESNYNINIKDFDDTIDYKYISNNDSFKKEFSSFIDETMSLMEVKTNNILISDNYNK
ncbi:MAG: hypothetical protein ACOCV8_05805 [Spirochaetota bacterium]